jgi:uncharacterized protein (DUF885 family)
MRIFSGCILTAVMALAVSASTQGTAKPVATATPADAAFQAIYKADEAWRRAQRGNESPEDEARHLPPAHLEHVDAATQAKALAHWEGLLADLSKIDATALSSEEHLNFEVYRAQIEVERNAVKFREYERPANSDTQFWGELAPGEGRSYRNIEQYTRYLSRLHDIPTYFDEQIANMRAGTARGFTPPRVTLEGRDQGLKDVVNAKDAKSTNFWKPFVTMPHRSPRTTRPKCAPTPKT